MTDTDGRTQAHGYYRGCIASRGKNAAYLLSCSGFFKTNFAVLTEVDSGLKQR